MIRSCSSLFFWLSMTIGASIMLYHTSDRVTALDHQLRELNKEIESEEATLHVLNAEWVYLANPARIEAQAQKHLALQPTAPRRVAALDHINHLLPLRDDGTVTDLAEKTDTPAIAPATESAETSAKPVASRKGDRVFALLNEGRINDRMVMQHSGGSDTSGSTKRAAPQAAVARVLVGSNPDGIGALVGTLGLRE